MKQIKKRKSPMMAREDAEVVYMMEKRVYRGSEGLEDVI